MPGDDNQWRATADAIRGNRDEHVRFAAYLDLLGRVAESDEADVVGSVLADPDRTMSQSAVLRHLDRRAAGLCGGPAYEPWARTMTRAVAGRPFLARRLREWSLFRAVALGLPRRPEDLLAASDRLQLKAAAGTCTAARAVLADGGRTKRIRNTAARPSRPRP